MKRYEIHKDDKIKKALTEILSKHFGTFQSRGYIFTKNDLQEMIEEATNDICTLMNTNFYLE